MRTCISKQIVFFTFLKCWCIGIGFGPILCYRSSSILTICDFSFFAKMCIEYWNLNHNGGVWRHMGACGCVTDAYECIRMHMDAYGCIWVHTRYQVLGTIGTCIHTYILYIPYDLYILYMLYILYCTYCTYCTYSVHTVHTARAVHTVNVLHTVHTVHTVRAVHVVHTVPYRAVLNHYA